MRCFSCIGHGRKDGSRLQIHDNAPPPSTSSFGLTHSFMQLLLSLSAYSTLLFYSITYGFFFFFFAGAGAGAGRSKSHHHVHHAHAVGGGKGDLILFIYNPPVCRVLLGFVWMMRSVQRRMAQKAAQPVVSVSVSWPPQPGVSSPSI